MTEPSNNPVLAGPILRKTGPSEVNLFLVTKGAVALEPVFSLDSALASPLDVEIKHQTVKVSDSAHIHLLTCLPKTPLPKDTLIYYDVRLDEQSVTHWMPDVLYPGDKALHFFIPEEISALFFGSCRNPHYRCDDTFVAADEYIAQNTDKLDKRPCVLIHGGDQVYVDDVAGPMLLAIHQLIDKLGLPHEPLPSGELENTGELTEYGRSLYNRQSLLPKCYFDSKQLWNRVLPWRKQQPVFSSVKAENHLIGVSEMIGMYLLMWSPDCWALLDETIYQMPCELSEPLATKFTQESQNLQDFAAGLARVRRLMAHVPNYMIFDDHDVTDDWNLTAQWEQNVYSNPLSRRVISNALLGYWLFQGWGNAPERFENGLVELVETVVSQHPQDQADALEEKLLEFPHWHYVVDLEPAIVVMDTRTHRWRSEQSTRNPSGLMDWERLLELEQQLVNKEAGIVVSAAPIFGVKFIETIQRIMTFCGQELAVDAENWMAHQGSARKLLDIFKRIDTPSELVVLSGDVHYSFCFTAKQRFKEESTLIWQLTSSGFKNEFPLPLIRFFDAVERWAYFAASPANLFTKRRALEIDPMPLKQNKKQILLSKSNIGLVEFKGKKLARYRILTGINTFREFDTDHA